MSETKFTPGPWSIGDHGDDIISEKDIEGDIIADAPRGWEHSMENWPANAKLISTAPDMFEIISELYKYGMESGHKGILFPKIEAAYLKVTTE